MGLEHAAKELGASSWRVEEDDSYGSGGGSWSGVLGRGYDVHD